MVDDGAITPEAAIDSDMGHAPPQEWLVIEWTAMAGDLDRIAEQLEHTAAGFRERAAYARDKAKEARVRG